ncbi:hypothetical protein LJC27_03295 [Christensenellaceae bacterium OttesenSCG-928-M15]|nr:hypothetical protein [Christensenellaceae bacterium OttesenSCG-928-M15]
MQTYMPMLVIRMKEGRAAIQLNGAMVGEATATAHLAVPLSDNGDYYIGVYPLDAGQTRFYPVMRKLCFRSGELQPVLSDDLEVYAWPDGVFEVVFAAGRLPPYPQADFPFTIDQISLNEACTATLYYDNGMKFAVEEGSRVLYGAALNSEKSGKLRQLSNRWLAVYCGEPLLDEAEAPEDFARILFILDENYQEIIRLTADAVGLRGEEEILCYTRLDTSLGHDRKQVFRAVDGRFVLEPETEIGFFTHSPHAPAPGAPILHAFCHAIRYRLWDEAMSYLTPSLKDGLDGDVIVDLLGGFTGVRKPAARADHAVGLLYPPQNGVTPVRVFSFSFEDGLIDNLFEDE